MSNAARAAEPPRTSPASDNAWVKGLGWCRRYCLSWTLFFIALLSVPYLYHHGQMGIDNVNLLGRYMALAIVAVSLDLIWGYAGMLCLCQAFFFCLGGYAMGMFLAHHGGPEGIIDRTGWKLPACLYVVYPYQVGESPADALVPWFWKPFWTLSLTVVMGLVLPAVIAGLIGFFVFRSRVRGVYFAMLTQAITLAAWLVFSMNNMKLGGTNGLTRFDHIMLGTQEKVQVCVLTPKLAEKGVTAQDVERALVEYVQQVPGAQLSGTDPNYFVVVPRGQHPWKMKDAIDALVLTPGSAKQVQLHDVVDLARFRLAGPQPADPEVRVNFYILSVLALGGAYALCRLLVNSRVGRILIAIRDNESRMRFFGYEPYVFKTFVFSLSAMLAGLGGMLYVPQELIITPHNMAVVESIMVVIWVAVGGRGTLSGAILGALVVKLAYYYFTSEREFLWLAQGYVPDRVYRLFIWQKAYWPFLLGGVFVAVVLFLPDGLVSLPGRLRDLGRRFWRRAGGRTDDAAAAAGEEADGAEDSAASMHEHLQRVVALKRERTISVQQRSLLDTELVKVQNVKVLFDGFKALDVDEFSIDYYELQVVIGPNGAGKTTLCDVISGKTRATSGNVYFGKRDITQMAEVDIARLGVGRKFQTPSIFDGLTVYESMELALPGRRGLARSFQRSASSADRDRIYGILQRVRLDGAAGQRVRYLSHGQRQWLEISMLLLAGPHLLLVDEPAAGLTDEETALTAELLLELQSEHSVLVIEHDMEFVRLLGAPVTVLNEGKVMAQGSLEQVQADPKVVEAYLGRGGTRHAV